MNLNEIREMVSNDIIIDETNLDQESLKTPQLHNKYLIFFGDKKLILKKLETDLRGLRKVKWLYYTGKLSEEELAEHGWEPFDYHVLKTDVDRFINADDQIITLENRVAFQKEKVDYLENVIKIVTGRQWNIKTALDWYKFTSGA